MSKNDSYPTGSLLDFSYHQNYCKIIGIDLLRQTNASIPQQINFAGKLKENAGETMFFVSEKYQKAILSFSLHSCNKMI